MSTDPSFATRQTSSQITMQVKLKALELFTGSPLTPTQEELRQLIELAISTGVDIGLRAAGELARALP